MATKTSKSPVSACFSRFSGIDTRHTHSGEPVLADLKNFRVLPDGSIQKREGFVPVHELPGVCRAAWTGLLDGRERTYLLCGSTVCTIIPENRSLVKLGTVSTASGDADFFYYRDALYLCEGGNLYRISNAPPEAVQPYVPLIGRDWPTTVVGELCERRNHATRRARITYVVEEPFIPYLRTAGEVESIEELWVNDRLLSEGEYSYASDMDSIVIPSLAAGDRVRALFTYSEAEVGESATAFRSCTRADTFGGIHNCRVVLWNGKQKNRLYLSEAVSAEKLQEAREWVPECAALYFPEHNEAVLGDGRYAVTGLCRHYDRLLLFTSDSTFKTDLSEAVSPEVTEINPYFGCSSPDAITHCENDPITVGRHAILRWNESTDEHNECNAEDISAPIASLLPDSFFATAIVHEFPERRELWFHARGVNDVVWIYGIETGAWYRFTGIRADRFLSQDGNVAFCNGNVMYELQELQYSDCEWGQEEKPIRAVMTSGILEYGSEKKKHGRGLAVRADGGALTVTLIPNRGKAVSGVFPEETEHRLRTKRISTGRFDHAILCVSAEELTGRPTIHSLISLVR